MAGYSGTPLPQKLGLRPGSCLWLINAPPGFAAQIEPLSEGARIASTARGRAVFDLIILFAESRAALERSFDRARARLDPAGGLWIAWPKKASGFTTDLSENVIRDLALAARLVDNRVCAIDETWSGLRVVVRLRDRPEAKRSPKPGVGVGRPGRAR